MNEFQETVGVQKIDSLKETESKTESRNYRLIGTTATISLHYKRTLCCNNLRGPVTPLSFDIEITQLGLEYKSEYF